MATRSLPRSVSALVVGLLAVLLALVGLSVVWGLTVEYGSGTDVLPLSVTIPTVVAALALLLWPGLSGRVPLLATIAVAGALVLAGLGAEQVGLREREQRTLEASADFGCNNVNSRCPSTTTSRRRGRTGQTGSALRPDRGHRGGLHRRGLR